MPAHWIELEENVFQFQDSCLVYAVRGPEGTVLINAGTGLAADWIGEVHSNGSLTVLLTHHFRDHTDGALRLHAAGAEILAPYWEQEYLVDPEQHFSERQIWNSYDNRWDRFSPVRPLPVSGWMMDYEKRRVAGLDWLVVPTPGVTQGASSYVCDLGGRGLAFVGEVICGPGFTSRLAPLQYNYNDLTGALNLWKSCTRILAATPDRLLPSLGKPMDDPEGAVQAFRQNLTRLDELQPGLRGQFSDPDEDDITEILPHLWVSKYGNARTHFIISDSGKVLSLDYGYNPAAYHSPGKQHLSNRRSFLHGLSGLKKHFGIERIDTVLVTHFHDDHVNGIPLLLRLFGTRVWAGEYFSDILERPPRYDRPCLWHEPIPVDRHLPSGETFHWENIPITLYPLSGHTRFATLVCLEVDGTRVVHTGDQIFFRGPDNAAYGPNMRMFTNHVYKNGLDMGCYLETVKFLKEFQPEMVLTGHTLPYQTDGRWFEEVERVANAFDEVHRLLMPLGDNEVHFGPESQGAKLKPYQMHLPEGGTAEFEGWVLNPFPTQQTAILKLVGPDSWQSNVVEIELAPREKKAFCLGIRLPNGTVCRRQPVALDMTVGTRPFGQVTEALVTAGRKKF